MNKGNTNKLIKFGFFPDHFFFECDNGWFEIIKNMCQQLKDAGVEPKTYQFTQIKEKFGSLRIYDVSYFGRIPRVIHYLDGRGLLLNNQKIQTNRFVSFVAKMVRLFIFWLCPKSYLLFKRAQSIIEQAETASKLVCEFCGKPGKLHGNKGWLKTFCPACYANWLKPTPAA